MSKKQKQEQIDSSKNCSVLLIACSFLLRKGNGNPYWLDYHKNCSLLTSLYLLRLRIGGYLSTIGSNLSHGHAFTQATALAWTHKHD